MKRVVLGLAIAAASLFSAPAADATCGGTFQPPCEICVPTGRTPYQRYCVYLPAAG